MVKVRDIEKLMENAAPAALAEKWDNPGLQVGSSSESLTGVLLSLDLTSEVIDEAVMLGCNLILTHHPLIMKPLSGVTDGEPVGALVTALIKNGISLFCAHTNLDKAAGGVNDCLAGRLGLIDVTGLGEYEEASIGRIGTLPVSMPLSDFALMVKESLGCGSVKYSGDGGKAIKTVALCSGSGSDFYEAAAAEEADVFVTGEVKHHAALYASEMGVSLVEAGHYETENVVLDRLHGLILSEYDIPVFLSEVHKPFLKTI